LLQNRILDSAEAPCGTFRGFPLCAFDANGFTLVGLRIQNCSSSLSDSNIITGKVGTDFVL
jgi:hypothetical protein